MALIGSGTYKCQNKNLNIKKIIYYLMEDNLTLYQNIWCFSMIPKHGLDNIVQIKQSENVDIKF